mgnify:FL=1
MTPKPVLAFACAFALSGAAQPAIPRVAFEIGMWETRIEVIAIEAPAMSEEARRQLHSTLENIVYNVCAGGETSNPLEDLKEGVVAGLGSVTPGGQCRFEEDRMSDGQISTVAICAAPDSRITSRTRIDGTYSSTRIGSDVSVVVSRADAAPDAPPIAQINSHFTMRRTGPCPVTSTSRRG